MRSTLLVVFCFALTPAWAQDLSIQEQLPHHPTVTAASAKSGGAMTAIVGAKAACVGGMAARTYPCKDVDLMSFLPIADMGGTSQRGSTNRSASLADIWGWTDPETNREYAIVCRSDGTAFVDVTDAENPAFLGVMFQPAGARPNTWRDAKTAGNYVFVVGDNTGNHGMQVFDLTRLRGLSPDPNRTFDSDARYTGITEAHNIVVNPASGLAIAVGAELDTQRDGVPDQPEGCGRGFHLIDVRNPLDPQFITCYTNGQTGRGGTGYVHDAQCVIYDGPDARYSGREICIGLNETAVDIVDVTDRQNLTSLGILAYPNTAYTHQGWLSEDHRYLFVDDELDERNGLATRTRTLVIDLEKLDEPVLIDQHLGVAEAIDHNQYTRDGYIFQANYSSGLRILDGRDPRNLTEVAFFDNFPAFDDNRAFDGAWSSYPYFASGNVVVSSIDEGLFVVRPTALSTSTAHRDAPAPDAFGLSLDGGQPVRGNARVTLALPTDARVTALLYDVMGRVIAQVENGTRGAGIHPLGVPTERLASGVYFLHVQAGDAAKTLRLVRVR